MTLTPYTIIFLMLIYFYAFSQGRKLRSSNKVNFEGFLRSMMYNVLFAFILRDSVIIFLTIEGLPEHSIVKKLIQTTIEATYIPKIVIITCTQTYFFLKQLSKGIKMTIAQAKPDYYKKRPEIEYMGSHFTEYFFPNVDVILGGVKYHTKAIQLSKQI